MARMIPPTASEPDDEELRKGELDVFEWLEKHTPDEWIALHSLRLKSHEFKKSGEADFVLLTDRGVLVIEVKGGMNHRNSNGQWVQTKKGHKDRISNEGPFKQAMGAYFALEKYLKSAGHRDLIDRVPWGWGVVMPHCSISFPGDDPEVDPEMLLDQKHFPEGFVDWANSLVEYWRGDFGKKNLRKLRKGHKQQEKISPSTRDLLTNLLRPRFECYLGLGQATREAEQELIRLTEKQCLYLLAVRSNRRTLMEGAAGTGKTLLAFEFARECAQKGERVLFVCFNSNLAIHLRSRAASIPEMSSVTIDNYHQLVKNIRAQAGLKTSFSSDWQVFNENCLELVMEALDILDDGALFDRIVVDEGQDLMSSPFLDVLDILVDGGLLPQQGSMDSGGKWLVAMDRAQALYSDNFEPSALDRLERCIPAKLILDENCRNTRPVAQHVYGFSQAGSCKVLNVEGPEPVVDYYQDQKSYINLLREYINHTILEYSKVDKSACDIALLTSRKELIPDDLFNPGMLDCPLKRFRDASKDDVVWETIHGFKGLEASTVILVGVEELGDEQIRQLMYVGGSRARTRLIWLLPEEFAPSVQVGLMEIHRGISDEAQ